MVDAFTATGACTNLGTDLANYWNCFVYAAFLNDVVILGIFFVLFLAIAGFALRLPMALMVIFGFSMLLGVLYVWNPPFLIPVLLGGVIIFAILVIMVMFRSGNLAQK